MEGRESVVYGWEGVVDGWEGVLEGREGGVLGRWGSVRKVVVAGVVVWVGGGVGTAPCATLDGSCSGRSIFLVSPGAAVAGVARCCGCNLQGRHSPGAVHCWGDTPPGAAPSRGGTLWGWHPPGAAPHPSRHSIRGGTLLGVLHPPRGNFAPRIIHPSSRVHRQGCTTSRVTLPLVYYTRRPVVSLQGVRLPEGNPVLCVYYTTVPG